MLMLSLLCRRVVWCAFLNQLVLGTQVMLPLTILVYMIRSLPAVQENGSPSEVLVGRYQGAVASLYPIGLMLTSYLWGRFSDRFGRKPVIIFGQVVSGAASVCLGLAGSHYFILCLARFVPGLLNGAFGAIKAALGESCDSTNQALGYSYLSMAWGLGSVVGPAMGGFASRPCEPSSVLHRVFPCGEGALLVRYPFLLPCLFMLVMSLTAAGITAVFLEETCPNVVGGKAPRAAAWTPALGDDDGDDNEEGKGLLAPEVDQDTQQEVELISLRSPAAAAATVPPPPPQWWAASGVVRALAGYTMVAFLYILMDETVPLYSSAGPEDGGLGLAPAELAG